jgi:hypothetical protein
MKQKTNRDVLFGLCAYDLLCRINNGLRNIDGGDVCVLDALEKHFTHSPYCGEYSCDKCIHDWLDREEGG